MVNQLKKMKNNQNDQKMEKQHMNLTAYNGFEMLENFTGGVEDYQKKKINDLKDQMSFIKKNFPNKQITVVELGSGNSKALFAMEKDGMLKRGYGVEISKSRYEFAQLWKKEWNFKNVENINANAVDVDFKKFEDFDLLLCVDLAFQFFEPIKENRAFDILKEVNEKLLPGGKIILELDGCDRILKRIYDGHAHIWEEFPEPDSWRFSLWDCTYDKNKKFMTWKKTFIKRASHGFFENIHTLRIYNKEEIRDLLLKAGFSGVEFYAGWDGSKFKEDTFEYVIVGTK